uniref:Uncharacterized protein n=1 Tax=Arundo donax TaxID=35708 RepID=A0A0A9HQ59_ARUDO
MPRHWIILLLTGYQYWETQEPWLWQALAARVCSQQNSTDPAAMSTSNQFEYSTDLDGLHMLPVQSIHSIDSMEFLCSIFVRSMVTTTALCSCFVKELSLQDRPL